jgi:hypothetical protein
MVPILFIFTFQILGCDNKLIKGHMRHIDAEAGNSPFRKK